MKQLMKHKTLAIAFLSVAGFSVGCNKEDTTSQQLDKVQAKTEEAAHEMKDYTFAQKAEFTAKMQSQLTELNRELDQLGARIEKSTDAVKAEAKPKFQALRDQTAGLNRFKKNPFNKSFKSEGALISVFSSDLVIGFL